VAEARARGEVVTMEISQPLVAYLCDTTARVLYHSSHGEPYPVKEMDYPHATMNRGEERGQRGQEGGEGCCHSTDDISSSPGASERDGGGEGTKGGGEYDEDETLKLIFSTPIVMIECTYLEDSFAYEAERRGHVVWSYLRPILIQHFTSPPSAADTSPHSTFILIHFSLRYSDEDIVAFFMDPNRCMLPNPSQSPPPPHTNPHHMSTTSTCSSGSGDGADKSSSPPHLILWLDTGIVRLWYQF
jgi:hypothetical protein